MATVAASINPAVLIWARESAGFSVDAAAEKMKIEVDKLRVWEAGVARPSFPQLRTLGEVYRFPIAVFYLAEPPARFQVLRDLRRLPGSGFRTLPPELVQEHRRAQQRRELALELAGEEREVIPAFELTATLKEKPEAVADRLRSALHITSEQQAKWRSPDGYVALRAWRDRIETAGVLVFSARTIASEDASGFAIFHNVLPVIVVNGKDTPTRRTFSLLHEFAHLLLRVSGVSDADTDASRPPEDQRVEVFCNEVAAAALMPRDVFLLSAGIPAVSKPRDDWSDADIRDLARSFGVSREAAIRRLARLGAATDDLYRMKREQYAVERAAQRQKLREQQKTIARNMPQETVSSLGKPLIRRILESYRTDRMTLRDVAGFLGVKTKHLPRLEKLVAG